MFALIPPYAMKSVIYVYENGRPRESFVNHHNKPEASEAGEDDASIGDCLSTDQVFWISSHSACLSNCFTTSHSSLH